MAPHSSTFAWKIPWTEEPGRPQSMGSLESDTTEQLHFHFSLSRIGEGNGNPLQCSCLENPRDGGAWWAAVYGVAQSWTLNHLFGREPTLPCMITVSFMRPIWKWRTMCHLDLFLHFLPSGPHCSNRQWVKPEQTWSPFWLVYFSRDFQLQKSPLCYCACLLSCADTLRWPHWFSNFWVN